MVKSAFLLAAILVLAPCPGGSSTISTSPRGKLYVFHYENVLGTSLELKIVASSAAQSEKAAEAALAEIARVLKPNGRLLFIEHVRSGDPNLAKRQDRIRPLYNLVGCNPNRETLAAIEASALRLESVRHGEVPRAPRVERPMIVGTARR